MSDSSIQLRDAANDFQPTTDFEDLRASLHALQSSFTRSWQERGVMLTVEERKTLLAEIRSLCAHLTDLTSSGC